MIDRLLPRTIDDRYGGNNIALYFFYFITALTLGRSAAHIVLADGGAQSIATIPLDSYSAAAADTVIFVFALWGMSQLWMGLMYLIVALRYKSLIPLMYVFILVDWSSRIGLGMFKTMETLGTPPGAIGNLVFTLLTPLMLYLALKTKPDSS